MEIEKWANFHREIQLERLEEDGYDYVKAKVAPWANFDSEKTYPQDYRRLLFSCLLDMYFSWKTVLDAKYLNKHYLKIWLNIPRFMDSQIVVAIGDKIEYYDSLFETQNSNVEFPIQMFKNDSQRISKFSWTSHIDYDYHLESEFTESSKNEYLEAKDYFAEQRYYQRLLKRKCPFNEVKTDLGEERLFKIKKGLTWVGEIK